MIIRNLKKNIRQQIIPQSSVYEQEDHTIERPVENSKRTLNPQFPLSETIVSKQQSFQCQSTEPLFDPHNQKQQKLHVYLSQEKPLELELKINEPIKRQLQNQQGSLQMQQPSRRWHIGLHILRQRKTERKRNFDKIEKLFNQQPLYSYQQNMFESKVENKAISIGKRSVNLPEFTSSKQTNGQKNTKDVQSNNLKSKFNKSVVRYRVSQNLNKFRTNKQQNKDRSIPRYTYNSLDDKSEASNHFNTAVSTQINSDSKKMIFQHIKGKTKQIKAAKMAKKIIPGDSQSTQQRYSTIFHNTEFPKVSDSEQEISPKGYFQTAEKLKQRISVSYKTTLLELKELCARQDLDEQEVIILVPEALSSTQIQHYLTQEEIFKKAKNVVNKLNIAHNELNIKKYSNCVVIVCENKAIIYYYLGKIYIGGWSCGQKMGLGLQLNPGKSVYYGQFRRNKRQGVGIYKGLKGYIKAGYWKDNHFQGNKVPEATLKLNRKAFLQNEEEQD